MIYLFFALPLISVLASAILSKKVAKSRGVRKGFITHIFATIAIFSICFAFGATVSAAPADDSDNKTATSASKSDEANTADSTQDGLKMIASALAIGLAGIGGGIAIASSAPAAIGAVAENPETFGKAIIFVALGEAIALYGFIVSFMILQR